MSLQPHIDRHAILSFEKQFHLFDIVGEQAWSADLEAGTITFGALLMGATLLGTRPTGAGCGAGPTRAASPSRSWPRGARSATGLVRDWPAALQAYEEARGLRLDGLIEFAFDELGRLTSLRSRLG